MTPNEPKQLVVKRPWWVDLSPIYWGTAIGLFLGIVLYVVSQWLNVKHQEVWLVSVGLTGHGGGLNSTASVPIVLPVWGFFLGMMVAMWKRVRRGDNVN